MATRYYRLLTKLPIKNSRSFLNRSKHLKHHASFEATTEDHKKNYSFQAIMHAKHNTFNQIRYSRNRLLIENLGALRSNSAQ